MTTEGSGAGSTVEDKRADERWASFHSATAVRCSARNANGGARCGMLAKKGTLLCYWHSRRSPEREHEQLRADLKAAQAEIERLKDADDEARQHRETISTLETMLVQARARLTGLIEAAREYGYNDHVNACRYQYRHCTCGYDDLKATLDAAQADSPIEGSKDTLSTNC